MTKIFGNPLYIKENYVEFYIGPPKIFYYFYIAAPQGKFPASAPASDASEGNRKWYKQTYN